MIGTTGAAPIEAARLPGTGFDKTGNGVMRFLFKAAFWLGLVFLLLPDNSPPPATGQTAASSVQTTGAESLAGAAIEAAAALCRSNAEACVRGAAAIGETAQRELIRAVVAPAADHRAPATGSASRDTLTPADLATPFGGVAAPAGNAPRRAPLPPRRPA